MRSWAARQDEARFSAGSPKPTSSAKGSGEAESSVGLPAGCEGGINSGRPELMLRHSNVSGPSSLRIYLRYRLDHAQKRQRSRRERRPVRQASTGLPNHDPRPRQGGSRTVAVSGPAATDEPEGLLLRFVAASAPTGCGFPLPSGCSMTAPLRSFAAPRVAATRKRDDHTRARNPGSGQRRFSVWEPLRESETDPSRPARYVQPRGCGYVRQAARLRRLARGMGGRLSKFRRNGDGFRTVRAFDLRASVRNFHLKHAGAQRTCQRDQRHRRWDARRVWEENALAQCLS